MIHIVTDTDANLSRETVRELGISEVAIHIIFGDEVLLEEFELGAVEGYRRLKSTKVYPTTSQPSPGDFKTVYDRLLADDPAATILSIHISGALSGTVSSAQQAAQMLPGADIHVFDTRSASLGQGLMAVEAARLARAGAAAPVILDHLAALRDRMQVMFALKTLENLARGGRIGRASYLMGSVLDIKPLLRITDGVLDGHSRHRTFKRAVEALSAIARDEIAAARGSGSSRLLLGVCHADSPVEGRTVGEALTEALKPDLLLTGEVGLGLGVHTGPGAVGVCWAVLPAP